MTDLTTLAVDHAACDYCGARPGAWCRVAAGRTVGARASYVHTARTRVVFEAWRTGFSEGLLEAVDRVERALARGEELAATLVQLRRWA